MNILDNKLVLKYFGCNHGADCNCTAENVLQAVQEPIKKGERYLEITSSCEQDSILELKANVDFYQTWYHGYSLRLPDKFQKKECGCGLHNQHPYWQSYSHADSCVCHAPIPKRECECECHCFGRKHHLECCQPQREKRND